MVWNKPDQRHHNCHVFFFFFKKKIQRTFGKKKNLQSPASSDPDMNLASSDFIEQSYTLQKRGKLLLLSSLNGEHIDGITFKVEAGIHNRLTQDMFLKNISVISHHFFLAIKKNSTDQLYEHLSLGQNLLLFEFVQQYEQA